MQILDHNLKAYKALIKSFKKANRACIVHPTGLGKSYIAYQLIADNPDSTFRVHITFYTLSQTVHDYGYIILREEGIVWDEKSEWSEGIEDEWEGRIEEENKESRESRDKEENREGIEERE